MNTISVDENGDVKNILYGDNEKNIILDRFPLLKINFNGKDNHIILEYPIKFFNSTIAITGNGHQVKIGKSSNNVHITLTIFDNNSVVEIGRNLYCGGLFSVISEDENSLKIGTDCMFSENIHIRTADGHAIFNIKTNKVINQPKNGVTIGNHVWLCRNVFIGKNASVCDDSVVGYGSVVTKNFTKKKCSIGWQSRKNNT